MATTSLWRVKGNIKKVLDYASNDEKTTVGKSELEKVVAYASREEATNRRQLVTGINCDPDSAVKTMTETKKRFGKENGTAAYHGYQSFAEGEVTPDLAHQIGISLAGELWGDRYEVVVCTHVDKDSHIHNHFVINTVSFVDGKKFYRSKSDYRKMQEASDRLCREQGLSVIRNPEGRGRNYGEWNADRNGNPTYREILIRHDLEVLNAVLDELPEDDRAFLLSYFDGAGMNAAELARMHGMKKVTAYDRLRKLMGKGGQGSLSCARRIIRRCLGNN